MKQFDAAHPRCIFPTYGAAVDAAMQAKNLSAEYVARELGIDASAVRGWRRGFGRNAATRTAQLEKLLGIKLDFSEQLPSKTTENTEKVTTPPHPVLPHLAAIALAHGYSASFTPLPA